MRLETDAVPATAPETLWDGTIVVMADGTFQIAKAGSLHELPVPQGQRAELRALVGLRDGASALLDAEAAPDSTSPNQVDLLDAQRAELKADYESYVSEFGPINRFTLRISGRQETIVDDETGEVTSGQQRSTRITPRVLVTFKQDPHSAMVRALEHFDEEEHTSSPSALLLRRVVEPRGADDHATSPGEAIDRSLDRSGGIDLQFIAHELGVDETDARARLGTLVYDEPGTGRLVHAPEYLSGDVRGKLEAATEASVLDERYLVNVEALRAVLPDPIGIEDIEARLGAVWISPDIHRQFLAELLSDQSVRVENPLPGMWDVHGNRASLRATHEWGTGRRPAIDIAAALMEQRRIEVRDEVEEGEGRARVVLNAIETSAAQEKADAMQERFADWVWEDPARAAELAQVYNRRFNAIRLRDYTHAGGYLTLPGLTTTYTLRPHQRAAIARMIAEPAVGLFHEVGAGKTLVMAAGAMELRRMHLITKPAVVVPNHMLEQFTREWLQAYPQAQILTAATDDVAGEKLHEFVARAAAEDWDAIIMTQTAFKKISVSPDFQSRSLEREFTRLRAAFDAAKAAGALGVGRIEKRVRAAKSRYEKSLTVPRKSGISFEDLGVDYLIVDEVHTYKNLATVSNIQDAVIDGSQQASDLLLKLEYLREEHGDRVTTVATATPIANSITEAHVMQRYLRPDLLEAAGITSFDGWAATFGSHVTELEMGPAGGFRLKTRFVRFQNVPEMLRMWRVFGDVKTGHDLQLPVPQIAPRASDGERDVETIVIEPTPPLERYIRSIAARAKAVASQLVPASEDNMLLISTDGRKAALDLRLVNQSQEPGGVVKLDAVAEQILQQWSATSQNDYLDDATGLESPIRGGLQLVFSDLGTPNEERWDAYNELKKKLVAGGMAADQVRFIHEANNDGDKARIFAAARAGHIAVLIGSTPKMGIGTNVQNRLTAMHHVDCPWRPADLEQRDGRGIRQGNQNDEVAIYRYVVERSFDAYSWQTVGRKATFINQIMHGRLDAREVDDIGDTALSAAEATALASGNPLILERATADAAWQKLQRQETAYGRAQAALVHTRDAAQATVDRDEQSIAQLHAAEAATGDVSGDNFHMTVGIHEFDNRADAATAIGVWAREHEFAWINATRARPIVFGSIAGHQLIAALERVTRPDNRTIAVVNIALENVPLSGSRVGVPDFRAPGIGLVRALENKTTAIPRNITALTREIAEARTTIDETGARIGAPFPHAAEVVAAGERVRAIDRELARVTR
ncbi:hypothetical protein GCM10027568_34470 [Humibacter soli]